MKPRAVIGINGPAGSGKTHFIRWLYSELVGRLRRVDRVGVVSITSNAIYPMMQKEGVSRYDVSYTEFKELEYARRLTIEFAENKRKKNRNVFLEFLWSEQRFQEYDVVIYDNIGFIEEQMFFRDHVEFSATLSIMMPWHLNRPGVDQIGRRFPVPVGDRYPGDSRFHRPAFNGWAAIDSAHMQQKTKLILDHATNDPGYAEPGVRDGVIPAWRYYVLGLPNHESTLPPVDRRIS